MESSKKSTTRFLRYSFIGLLLFSIIIFSFLGIYMNRQSKKTIYDVGKIYMSGMNKQMSVHFESVIKLRFDEVDGIVSVVSTENSTQKDLYEELIYRAQVRNFNYLALCSMMNLQEVVLALMMANRMMLGIYEKTKIRTIVINAVDH